MVLPGAYDNLPAATATEYSFEAHLTTLEVAAMNETLFNHVWRRIESKGIVNALKLLIHEAFNDSTCIYICRFATGDLASRMLLYGIDLSDAVSRSPDALSEIFIYNEDPSSLLNWLRTHGCRADDINWLLLDGEDEEVLDLVKNE
ncbi:hypothetical protein N7478_000676 [Penicillium angulare]|uniref:uncharacterized protein n=1 Tax=Penicillium angulare TaxID=116970 RepID=UPI00254148D0|nr:uncharacterized protein N7478_000676 [Penicillium angulare]KAJ5291425.1 hypothetical protein N7478_000676 [Penicillium angulare]